MTFIWITLGALLLVAVVITLVDIIRRGGSIWGMLGWSALVVLLPFVGSTIYWVRRKPDAAEIEQERMMHEDLRRSAADRPFDSTGMWR